MNPSSPLQGVLTWLSEPTNCAVLAVIGALLAGPVAILVTRRDPPASVVWAFGLGVGVAAANQSPWPGYGFGLDSGPLGVWEPELRGLANGVLLAAGVWALAAMGWATAVFLQPGRRGEATPVGRTDRHRLVRVVTMVGFAVVLVALSVVPRAAGWRLLPLVPVVLLGLRSTPRAAYVRRTLGGLALSEALLVAMWCRLFARAPVPDPDLDLAVAAYVLVGLAWMSEGWPRVDWLVWSVGIALGTAFFPDVQRARFTLDALAYPASRLPRGRAPRPLRDLVRRPRIVVPVAAPVRPDPAVDPRWVYAVPASSPLEPLWDCHHSGTFRWLGFDGDGLPGVAELGIDTPIYRSARPQLEDPEAVLLDHGDRFVRPAEAHCLSILDWLADPGAELPFVVAVDLAEGWRAGELFDVCSSRFCLEVDAGPGCGSGQSDTGPPTAAGHRPSHPLCLSAARSR